VKGICIPSRRPPRNKPVGMFPIFDSGGDFEVSAKYRSEKMWLRYFGRKTTPEYLPWRKFMTMNATKEGDGEVQGRCTGKPQSGENLGVNCGVARGIRGGDLTSMAYRRHREDRRVGVGSRARRCPWPGAFLALCHHPRFSIRHVPMLQKPLIQRISLTSCSNASTIHALQEHRPRIFL
jgi:hypothetical protein